MIGLINFMGITFRRDDMKYKTCATCKDRPGITEDGTFFCHAVDEMVSDDEPICWYYRES